jgi:hypothetical protein
MKKPRISKKEIERWHLSRFEESYPDFPSGEVHPGERPDFRIVSGERTIGVELTQVFHANEEGKRPLQEIERLRAAVTERAEALFAEAGGPPLDVLVFFSPHAKLGKPNQSQIAERLAALVSRNIPPPGTSYEEEFDWVNRDWFPEELSYVRVARFDHRDWSLWQPASAGYVPDVTPELIQAAIERKAPDVEAHRASCDEAWLLIIADGFGISSTMTVTEACARHRYRSPFDKTFYFENFRKSAYELRVS